MAKRLNPLKNAVRAAPANYEDFRKTSRINCEDFRKIDKKNFEEMKFRVTFTSHITNK